MSWDLLKRFLESDVFNQNPFLSVAYLSRYADHVGIHYVLCSKLRQFSSEEIEFFLPQLCHLIISVDNESMALEDFILELCEESVNAALLTFWLFQTYLHDLSSNPQSEAFRTCRRIFNKVQHIVFGVSEPSKKKEKIKENVMPVTVLASFVLASVAVPFLPQWAGPLAIAQARKPQAADNTISYTSQTQKLGRSSTVGASSRPLKLMDPPKLGNVETFQNGRSSATASILKESLGNRPQSPEMSRSSPRTPKFPPYIEGQHLDPRLSTTSLPLPELRTPRPTRNPHSPGTPGFAKRPKDPGRRHSDDQRTLSPSVLTTKQKTRFLKQHYFRSETLFLNALEDISNRLVIVPKAARLSALRAELALIAQDLPAEVDIPVICPPTLVDGAPSKSRHHRIVRLNPSEATVLNSAEKVPYLLMVEVLRDDFSFNPDTAENEALLVKLMSEQGSRRRRLFDLSEASRASNGAHRSLKSPDSVFEPSTGDLSSTGLSDPLDSPTTSPTITSPLQYNWPIRKPSPLSSITADTPKTDSTPTSRSTSPGPSRRPTMLSLNTRTTTTDQSDVSALATHMRMASQMLAQLDSTSGKRPKAEVAAIRAKIIASMQSLDEQSFENEIMPKTSFDSIIASANAATPTNENQDPEELEAERTLEHTLSVTNRGAGAARMENDQKTGGVQRKGDCDDPSAATFGEAWNVKKERIRKSSPYGWMKNWDLLSVIVKTGADLRQEAFACQLIKVCDKIWKDAGVPVWVKQMRILVTGESSGLIETITNGVSVHSLKRSLTLSTVENGQNPRGRIATLKDHFIKAFGSPDTEAHKAGEDAFKRSLAAYSMISYVLQLKDRHNGNVLIDSEGHIVHIDFGFMLSNSPGSVGFEAAPFKLTQEYVDVLGGVNSPAFEDYKKLCKQAFQALRKSAESLIDLVNMMGVGSKMPCYSSGVLQTTNNLRQRFVLQLSKEEAEGYVEKELIGKSLGSYYTRLYDTFQYRTQGIY